MNPNPPSALRPWWTREGVRAVLADLVRAELERLDPLVLNRIGVVDPRLDLADLGLSSLALIDLATTVVVQFRLDETGYDAQVVNCRCLEDWVELILESRAARDESMGFLTSGSTGQPKLCLHRMAFLEQEIEYFAGLFADRRRILSAVPRHHIYGFLFAFMLPARLGIPAVDVRQVLPGAVLRQALPGDLIIGYPAFFELACRVPFKLTEEVVALTSTSPCPAELWRVLAELGCARIVEIYGSSETAGIGWRDQPQAEFQLLPYWSRVPDAPDHLQRRDAAGTVYPWALPDQVLWTDDRHLKVLGRRDGAVQIGGINVYPERVAACLREHPEVAEALVRPAGQGANLALKAFVVPSASCPDPHQLPERLHLWLTERLPPLERPRSIRVGSALPQSSLGKPADWDEEGP